MDKWVNGSTEGEPGRGGDMGFGRGRMLPSGHTDTKKLPSREREGVKLVLSIILEVYSFTGSKY